MKQGHIIPNGISLEKHENETIIFFTNLGHDIELIPPSNTPKSKTPDFIMDGIAWEMKSPHGSSRTTVEHALKRAAKQSENVILDLRNIKTPTPQILTSIEKLFKTSKRIRRLKIITKEQNLLDFKR